MKMNLIVAIHVHDSGIHCDDNDNQRQGNSCGQSDICVGRFCHAFNTILSGMKQITPTLDVMIA